jgi:hypothetical protein
MQLANQSIFHQDWWLEIASEGNWSRIEVVDNQDLIITLPFTIKKKFNLTIIGQDRYSAFLGPAARIKNENNKSIDIETSKYYEISEELISKIPKCSVFAQKFSTYVKNTLPWIWCNYSSSSRYTHVLNTLPIKLRSNISADIKRAKKNNLIFTKSDNVDKLISMQIKNFKRQKIAYPYKKNIIFLLIEECIKRKKGNLYSVYNEYGDILAMNFIVNDLDRKYNLFSARTHEFSNNGAQSYCLSQSINESMADGSIFDFEGSMHQGIEKFYRGFNPDVISYQYVEKINSMFLKKLYGLIL